VTSLPQETKFHPEEVITIATSGRVRDLMKAALPILESVNKHTPKEGWLPSLPTWGGIKHRRGLLGWGQMRKKDKKNKAVEIVNKRWAVPQIQRAALTAGITAWMDCVGLPPTCAGN
jgi:hypothetical protein